MVEPRQPPLELRIALTPDLVDRLRRGDPVTFPAVPGELAIVLLPVAGPPPPPPQIAPVPEPPRRPRTPEEDAAVMRRMEENLEQARVDYGHSGTFGVADAARKAQP